MRRETGLTLIIAYKFIKAGLWFVLAVVLVVGMRTGLEGDLLCLADRLRHHAHAWSLEFARLVVRAATRRGLWTITVALLADGCMSLLEGWSLVHGAWWGPWLVVVATSALLPFEVVSLARRVHPVRVAIFALNVVIVIYLARKAMRERVRSSGGPGAPPTR